MTAPEGTLRASTPAAPRPSVDRATGPVAATRASDRVLSALAAHRDGPAPAERWVSVAVVAGFHALALWGALQLEAVRNVVAEVAPTFVTFVAPPQPERPQPPPPPQSPAPPRKAPATPPVVAIAPTPQQAVLPTFTVPQPEPLPAPVAAAAPAVEAPAVVTAPAPETAPSPRLIPATAVRYRVPPALEVPLASRRAGEQGLVVLRVRVGRDGLPQAITVHSSSGYARLDQQALSAMRAARFEPQTENGEPIEWIVLTPLQYELD